MAKNPSIGPFRAGMNNRRPDFKLALSKDEGGGHLLRDAVNVDVTGQGTIKTRAGYTLVEQGLDCHSAWAPVARDFGLYCDSADLYRFDVLDDGSTQRTQIAAGFGRVTPVVYAQVNEAVYFTDGLRCGSYHPVQGPTPAWQQAAPKKVGDVQFSPMPAGSSIAYHAGRLLVAVGQYLIYSEPFTPNLRDESRGFEVFPAPITCLAAVEGGVFVMADQTYFLPAGVPSQAVRAVLSYGAPQQMAGYTDDGGAFWMAAKGLVRANAQGELANVQERHIAMEVSGSAATLHREADGAQAIVATLSQPESIAASVGSYAQARLVRKENP